jgi:hypothetical protein
MTILYLSTNPKLPKTNRHRILKQVKSLKNKTISILLTVGYNAVNRLNNLKNGIKPYF